LIAPLFCLGQEVVSGFITDINNRPVSKAVVYFKGISDLTSVSNAQGFFKIDYSGYDVSDLKLIVHKDGYKEKSFSSRKISDLMVITIEFDSKNPITDSAAIYENEIVELDEGIFYSSFEVDDKDKIDGILDKIKKNYSQNYPDSMSTYEVKGFHSLTEKVSETQEDTLLYLKNPLHLELTSYHDKEIHLNSKIVVQPNSTLYVRNNRYNVSKDSPFFLYEQFSWIDFIDKDFLNKKRNYEYRLTYEDDNIYEISFKIKKVQEDSWSGVFTVDKKDFAILDLEIDLEFNRKNSYTIVNKNETKNATSLIYFEGAKIHWNFEKSDSGFYKIHHLDANYRIIHVGVNPDYTPQFFVNTKFDFNESALPEECKILPLNDLLYIAFQKNYANFRN
jgi:hypothetical protein